MSPTRISRAVPIVRIFDETKAKEFYVGYLGFTVDWEHRFADELPLYMQIHRDELVIHLSEHHGDGSPGIVLYIDTSGVRDLHRELQAKLYRYLNPGLSEDDIGVCLEVLDPFGNRLRFNEPPPSSP